MKSLNSKVTKALPVGAEIEVCDNSGAKVIKLFAVKGHKTVKGRIQAAGIGDMIYASVKKGKPDMKKQKVNAIIVRQKKEFRRLDGTRVMFEDNAAIVLKDDKGNPKGTLIKGPIAKEVTIRWPAVAKIAKVVL